MAHFFQVTIPATEDHNNTLESIARIFQQGLRNSDNPPANPVD
jgi:hypothetical protein